MIIRDLRGIESTQDACAKIRVHSNETLIRLLMISCNYVAINYFYH